MLRLMCWRPGEVAAAVHWQISLKNGMLPISTQQKIDIVCHIPKGNSIREIQNFHRVKLNNNLIFN
jgi:hypothetical protein